MKSRNLPSQKAAETEHKPEKSSVKPHLLNFYTRLRWKTGWSLPGHRSYSEGEKSFATSRKWQDSLCYLSVGISFQSQFGYLKVSLAFTFWQSSFSWVLWHLCIDTRSGCCQLPDAQIPCPVLGAESFTWNNYAVSSTHHTPPWLHINPLALMVSITSSAD